MATTLKQFWTGEVARITARLASLDVELTTLRGTTVIDGALTLAQNAQAAASRAITNQAKAVDDARKALAAIPMPGDGDPLLLAMEQALMDLADARSSLARSDEDVQALSAELKRLQDQQATLQAALAEATKALIQAGKDADLRQKWIDALTSGDLMTLAADAAAALTASEAAARTRIEGEFPGSSTAAKDFLTRARARRSLPQDSLTQATAVETAAFNAGSSALAQAQRAFQAAAEAVRQAFNAAPRLAADTAVLQRLASLPASAPIATPWQHNRLHDAAKKTDRENALAKLKEVDGAAADVRTAQTAYDTALHAAIAANPDKTRAELDAGVVKPKKDDLAAKQSALATKRSAMNAGEIRLVNAWFAAVPDPLWAALDQLDTAASRLKALVGPPDPSDLVTAMTAAEAALVTALDAHRLAQRKLDAAALAGQRAAGLLASERATAAARSSAFERSATLF